MVALPYTVDWFGVKRAVFGISKGPQQVLMSYPLGTEVEKNLKPTPTNRILVLLRAPFQNFQQAP